MKNMLKKIYKKAFYPALKILYKPILDEIARTSLDRATIYGIEALLRKELMPKYNILSPSDSIDFIVKSKRSFVRLGDGDLPILCGKGGGMHRFDEFLKLRLCNALHLAHRRKMPIGLNVNLVKNFNLNESGFFYACEVLNAYGAIKYLPSNATYFDGVALRYSPLDFYLLDSKIRHKINAESPLVFSEMGGGKIHKCR